MIKSNPAINALSPVNSVRKVDSFWKGINLIFIADMFVFRMNDIWQTHHITKVILKSGVGYNTFVKQI